MTTQAELLLPASHSNGNQNKYITQTNITENEPKLEYASKGYFLAAAQAENEMWKWEVNIESYQHTESTFIS